MDKLRKSIPHLWDLSYDNFSKVLYDKTITFPFTEKTDGFCFQVGYDHEGFFVRSATSDKMRKFGDFGRSAYEKFGNTKEYDPFISSVLDLALHVLKNSSQLNQFLKEGKKSIAGEMILVIDNKPFSPNKTYHNSNSIGTYGTFIIHTRSSHNFHLSFLDIDNLVNKFSSLSLSIDHDVNAISQVTFSVEDMFPLNRDNMKSISEKLNDRFLCYLPKQSKWTSSKAEGYIIHVNPFLSFKVMTKKS